MKRNLIYDFNTSGDIIHQNNGLAQAYDSVRSKRITKSLLQIPSIKH